MQNYIRKSRYHLSERASEYKSPTLLIVVLALPKDEFEDARLLSALVDHYPEHERCPYEDGAGFAPGQTGLVSGSLHEHETPLLLFFVSRSQP